MLSDSRSMVATSRMVGKAENSSGFSIHSETIRISTDRAMEKARPKSIRKAGIGRKKMHRIAMMPKAKKTSRRPFSPERRGNDRRRFSHGLDPCFAWRQIGGESLRQTAGASKAFFDPAIDLFGEAVNLRADEALRSSAIATSTATILGTKVSVAS